jgi:hypothetical protein
MPLTLRPDRCAVLAALALGACASQTPELTTAAMPTTPPAAMPVSAPGQAGAPAQTVSRLPAPSAAGSYQMTADDLALDCKKLTGRMAVRIVQLRDFQSRAQTTLVSRTLQTTTATVLGGTKEGTDPDGRYARDLAQLEAYNQRLAEKDCPNFDLAASLDPAAKDPPRTQRVKKQ